MSESLFNVLEQVAERVVVKPGQCVPMLSIKGNVAITRTLVDEAGNECNSVGKPLPGDNPKPPKPKRKKSRPVVKAEGEGE